MVSRKHSVEQKIFKSGNGLVAIITAPGASGTGAPTYKWKNLENGDESDNTNICR